MQLFVDHLTVIDCSYLHPEHGIEGESWIVDVALDGALDDQSMIMDFGLVKKRLKAAIDRTVDHKLLLPLFSDCLIAIDQGETECELEWLDNQERPWFHGSPADAVTVIECDEITPQSVTEYLYDVLQAELPESVDRLNLTLRHEALEDGLYYHYSHGLKKHDGNCQRIAHGHRSKLEVWRDGERDEAAIRDICARWKHCYLVSQEDIEEQNSDFIESGYTAPQGRFWLKAPADACDILPGDSTVECIAEYLADQLKARAPDAEWCVKAYEGVRKGAIATRSSG